MVNLFMIIILLYILLIKNIYNYMLINTKYFKQFITIKFLPKKKKKKIYININIK